VAVVAPGSYSVAPPAERTARGRDRIAGSSSAARTRRTSGPPTRTPTSCCASTSPSTPTCPCTAHATFPRPGGLAVWDAGPSLEATLSLRPDGTPPGATLTRTQP
jgi:hypothetical protein